MKKIITAIFTITLSFGVFAQQNDTMFVHSGQTIFHISTAEVDSIVFYPTGTSVPMGTVVETIIRDTIFAVLGMTLNETVAWLLVGQTFTLTATFQPENATNKTVIWTSSDPDIATVVNGVVTAVSVGEVTITATTEDGNHTAICKITVAVVLQNRCNTHTPGWGESLGTVSFAPQGHNVVIEGNNITQTWSGAVTATNCQKTTFAGGSADNLNADCRSNVGLFTFPGNLFSWCAVVRFADVLCPYPWRVPTMQDFIDLDIAMDGNGNNRGDTPQIVTDNYITRWGGAFGGNCTPDGNLANQWTFVHYWSQTDGDASTGRALTLSWNGSIHPQGLQWKNTGNPLRCVR